MRYATIIAALAIAACSGEPSETSKMAAGKQAVTEMLRDPDSAEFRNLKLGSFQGRGVVCGEVNAANGFGGMTGFQHFISDGGEATVIESQMSEGDFAGAWGAMCGFPPP